MVALINVICGIYARNEAPNIDLLFKSLFGQTRPFNAIVFLDDGSTDATKEILCEVMHDMTTYTECMFTEPHENYLRTNKLHITVNTLLNKVYTYDPDLFMIVGGDTVLGPTYLKTMLHHFACDSKLVIGSGQILGEPLRKDTPRGTGRLYNASFMQRFCCPLPSNALWESYPLYKALSMGLHIRAFSDASMITQRSTQSYKTYYGYAMRQLGYFPLYAYMKLLRNILVDKSAINTLRAYRQKGHVYDEQIRRWLTRYQIKRILRLDF